MAKKKVLSGVDDLRKNMEQKRSVMEAMRLAYLHRTPFDGKIPEYENVKQAALDFIELNYELQRALFGKIRVKLSVAKLFR